MIKSYLSLAGFLCFLSYAVHSQPIIYKDAATLITGTWSGAGTGGTATLTEITGQTPHEGTKHYRFDYTFSEWWAGLGLNLDNWGTNPARNLSGYSHLRIAYRGLSAGQTLTIRLRNNNDYGNTVDVGTPAATYGVVDIPVISLTVGTALTASAVREIDLSISGAQTGTGTVFFDALEMVNVSTGPVAASSQTMARAASLGRGVNTSNWLEAYWLLPFNAYPDATRYTRTKIRDLVNAGFTTFRLPVTFERLNPTTPPDPIDFNQEAFALVDSMILWAGIYGFNLVIVNHHGYNLTNANYPTEATRISTIWGELVDHYDYLDPNQFFFEIYNEPTPDISNTNFRTLATQVVATIRAHETQTHSVFVGANGWNSGDALTSFTPLADPDVIYTFHNYDPYFFTHQGMSWTSPPYLAPRTFPQSGEVAALNQLFAAVKSWSTSYSVPVSLGEYGCSTAADATSRCNWIQAISTAYYTNGFSHFYWDAISPSDAFGFFNGGIIDNAHCIPCFKTALGLYALPIELASFEVVCKNNQSELQWTANTVGTDPQLFEIQGSNNGTDWESLNSVAAIGGHAEYRAQPAREMRFYRLVSLDDQGNTTYSPSRSTPCSTAASVDVSPNPTASFARLRTTDSGQFFENATLYDLAGRAVWQQHFLAGQTVSTVEIPVYQFPVGTYFVAARLANGEQWREQLVVVR